MRIRSAHLRTDPPGAITTSAHRVRDVWATFCRTSTHVNHRVARAALSPESSKLGFGEEV